jgi:putative transcriptional regulator
MIKVKLQDMMWQKRIKSVSELSRSAGVSRQTVDALYNRADQVKGIQFETLDRLCRAMGCRIDELIEYVSDEVLERRPQIDVVREEDSDYAIFETRVDEPAMRLEDCDDLFERLDHIRRQRDA